MDDAEMTQESPWLQAWGCLWRSLVWAVFFLVVLVLMGYCTFMAMPPMFGDAPVTTPSTPR
jgi:hypothetical protein